MLNMDYSKVMLDLKEAIITKAENISSALHIHLELPRRPHSCPACGRPTERVHDYRMQVIKDIPLGKTTYLHLRKRRYCCEHCGKRFYEENTFLPRYYRLTNRMVAAILHAFRKLTPATSIAVDFNISPSTAIRYFDRISYRCRELPEVLSIDEFKGNAGGEKYQSILTDPKNKRTLDILPNRYESSLIAYFKQFPDRKKVKYFVTDMNPHFRSVAKVCFPQAVVIADRYHVIRQANWAMENVRKAEQKKLSKKFRKYFKRSRSLLSKPYKKLTLEEMDSLSLMFEIAPRLATAYQFKNQFLKIMHLFSSEDARKPLADWIYAVELANLPEFAACTTAYHNWTTEILNSLDVPWTNGYTEGCNNKTKVLKRVCFGVQNFNRFRNRILHCAT